MIEEVQLASNIIGLTYVGVCLICNASSTVSFLGVLCSVLSFLNIVSSMSYVQLCSFHIRIQKILNFSVDFRL